MGMLGKAGSCAQEPCGLDVILCPSSPSQVDMVRAAAGWNAQPQKGSLGRVLGRAPGQYAAHE